MNAATKTYRAGYAAFAAGQTTNPFDTGSTEAIDWQIGYDDAALDADIAADHAADPSTK